jgi:hypothetical protein
MLISYCHSNTNLYTPIILLNFGRLFRPVKTASKGRFILELGLLQIRISFDVRKLPTALNNPIAESPTNRITTHKTCVLPSVTPHVRTQARDPIQKSNTTGPQQAPMHEE